MAMKTVAYLRVSTGGQDLASQKLAVLECAAAPTHFTITVRGGPGSSPRLRQREQILQTVESLEAGDRLVVSELSRLGRSLGQIIQVVDQLLKKRVAPGCHQGPAPTVLSGTAVWCSSDPLLTFRRPDGLVKSTRSP